MNCIRKIVDEDFGLTSVEFDNPNESYLHFLIAYLEHKLMTRFMFPNIILERVKVK